MNDLEYFDSILRAMRKTYIAKNNDYGNSFGNTFKEFEDKGVITAATQISHKYHRFINLVKGTNAKVNETLEDTLLDMANYCILTLIELEKEKKEKDKVKELSSEYSKIIYISHPYQGKPENYDEISAIVIELQEQHPDWLILSPVHAFSILYNVLNYDNGLNRCLWLLDKADEMRVYGDYLGSKGCVQEIAYCKEHNIPYKFIEE